MITYLLLAITIGLGVLSMFLLRKACRKPLRDGILTALLSLSLGIFIYLYGTWVFLSIYAKYVFGVLYLLLGLYFLWKRKPVARPTNALYKIVLIIFFGTCCILYFTGTTGVPEKVELDFPLKKGRYFVIQGGKGLPTNLFHFSLRGAIYAMDIVKLNDFGNRANTVFSSNLEDYEIFGDTIYSPCKGRVVRAYGGNPDNIPPNMARGPRNTNAVVIETDNYTVFMGHLKMNSVMVKEGDVVTTGQPLGRVGNSGFSSEPHLHIQVHKNEKGKAWYMSTPLYILFNGNGYLLNEVIKKKHL